VAYANKPAYLTIMALL